MVKVLIELQFEIQIRLTTGDIYVYTHIMYVFIYICTGDTRSYNVYILIHTYIYAQETYTHIMYVFIYIYTGDTRSYNVYILIHTYIYICTGDTRSYNVCILIHTYNIYTHAHIMYVF